MMDVPYTNDELQGAAPIKNPVLSCEWCDASDLWENIKDSEWQVSNDPDVPFICPACQDIERRKAENKKLEEYDP